MDDLIQLKITLKGSKPPIWRRVLVLKQTSFFELHHIIQIAMGWDNYHLFEFKINNYRIGEPDDEFEDMDFGNKKVFDANTMTLDSIIVETKEKFEYEYDFGDGWKHQILVEKFLPVDNSLKYPICIGGKLDCPPEDCGGIDGYYYLLEVLGNKKHPDREDMKYSLESFDPNHFDIDFVNESLLHLDQYLADWSDN
jgi:hypothetical protein